MVVQIDPLKYLLGIFSYVMICPYPREYIWLISKKTIFIKCMCMLSFNYLERGIKRDGGGGGK